MAVLSSFAQPSLTHSKTTFMLIYRYSSPAKVHEILFGVGLA